MKLVISGGGTVRAIHSDSMQPIIEKVCGPVTIRRASHVDVTADLRPEPIDELCTFCEAPRLTVAEFNEKYRNKFWADLGPVDGPILGPFETRGEALAAEAVWIEANALGATR